jgi:hypothetical protein
LETVSDVEPDDIEVRITAMMARIIPPIFKKELDSLYTNTPIKIGKINANFIAIDVTDTPIF